MAKQTYWEDLEAGSEVPALSGTFPETPPMPVFE